MILRLLALGLPVVVATIAITRAAGRRDLLSAVPLSAGLGLGAASVVWWLLLQLPVTSSTWLLALDTTVWIGLAFAALAIQPAAAVATPNPGNPRPSLAVWIAATLLLPIGLLAIASFVGGTAVAPHGEWDAWAVWNQHARFLFKGYPTEWRAAFSPALAWFHPSYPLLLPLSVARGWMYAGRDSVVTPIGLAALFAVATVTAAATAVARIRGTARGLAAAAVLLASPTFVTESAGQIADVPLGFYLLATFIFIERAIESRSSRCWILAGASAGLAAWTKDEGLLFVLVLSAVCATWRVRSAGGRGVNAIRSLAAGAIPALIVLAYFKLRLAPPNELVTAQTLDHIVSTVTDTGRLKMVLSAFGGELWRGGASTVGVLPILAVYVTVSGVRRPLPAAPALAVATMILIVAGYALVYVATPFSLTWHLRTSLGRVLMQVLPTLVWAGMTIAGRD